MINELEITVGNEAGKSYLKDMYFTSPFKIADLSRYQARNILSLMMMSSSPGILDQDNYQIKINLEKKSRLRLETQSYQRLFQMINGAKQTVDVCMDTGAQFSYIPHPVVPHKNSVYESFTRVFLEQDTTFTYSEIITCGRKYSGEIFQFRKFRNLTEIYFQNKLILKDNLYMEPEVMQLDSLGMLEHYTHQATWMHIHTGSENNKTKMNHVRQMLEDEKEIVLGITEPGDWGFVIRILGNEAELIYTLFKKLEHYIENQ